ncbi:BA14K family protein [Sphingobium sp.]|uniref:BA14K family protein n=1 Tax=Sphingobium sp. TaxID=1912891 RepID=UPI002C6BD202|nr:BA14K family protein [Sphingobium sp.]HUD95686.1 BA14K family protein [Sphingobium sp.]
MSARLTALLGTMLIAAMPLALSAQPAPHPSAERARGPGAPVRPEGNRPVAPHPEADRPGASHPEAGREGNGYGRWDDRWGKHPPEPPRHWTNRGDWYRHVRACRDRYRSYDPRTDMFTLRRGTMRRCTL